MFAGAADPTQPTPTTAQTPPPNAWVVQQPIWNNSSNMDLKATMNLGTITDPAEREKYWGAQVSLQKWGMLANTGGALMNLASSITGMVLNKQVIDSYYGYMNKVADNGMAVALKQLDVQEYAIDKAMVMQEEEQGFQVKLAKIGQARDIQLARISERGKTDRTALYTANNAFGMRSSYPGGSPMFSTH